MVSAADFDRLDYEKRVNRVIDHISAHLAEDLSLEGLARVAAFSPFHFHRIFRAVSGETLFGFVQRLRLERAALALVHHRDHSILAVALDHGSASAATFARAFKAHFGMSPTAWRRGGAASWSERRWLERKTGKQRSKPGKQVRKAGNARARRASHTDLRKGDAMNVRVQELPPQRVVYMRYVGPYGAHGIPELWERFVTWMQAHGLDMDTTTRLGVAHDNPAITQAEKCRYDACAVVREDFQPDRSVNVASISGGRYAVSSFRGTAHEIEAA